MESYRDVISIVRSVYIIDPTFLGLPISSNNLRYEAPFLFSIYVWKMSLISPGSPYDASVGEKDIYTRRNPFKNLSNPISPV